VWSLDDISDWWLETSRLVYLSSQLEILIVNGALGVFAPKCYELRLVNWGNLGYWEDIESGVDRLTYRTVWQIYTMGILSLNRNRRLTAVR
jgi:hypothetical protein